jgi:hypothetical protein
VETDGDEDTTNVFWDFETVFELLDGFVLGVQGECVATKDHKETEKSTFTAFVTIPLRIKALTFFAFDSRFLIVFSFFCTIRIRINAG